MSQTENTAGVPIPHRLDRLEAMLETVTGTIDKLGPILAAFIPAARPVVAVASAVGHIADEVIDTIQGENVGVDAAALAVHGITKSTGDATLDARLATIEAVIMEAVPLLRFLAKEFGMDFIGAMPEPVAAIQLQGATINAVQSETAPVLTNSDAG